MKSEESIIVVDPEIHSGDPVFRGTRVTIQTLFDYLTNATMEDFERNFPHISREMVNQVLREVAKRGIPRPKRPKLNAHHALAA